ncbi:MAG: four helix bundle protein [Ignavibacteriae bacterium]|nr:MAG: four helix bundle protein [Ignavibacteriota bacterium]
MERFEDLNVWKQSREFCKVIYELTSKNEFKKDYGLKDQIQRAVVSILTNIAEGLERDSNPEFKRFLNYSKGSAGEVRTLIYIAYDLNYITKKEFKINLEQSISIIKQLSSFIKYLRTTIKPKT